MSLAKNVLTIGFDEEFAAHIPLVDNSRNHALIQTKLAELGHPHVLVKFIKAEAPPKWKNAPPADSCARARSSSGQNGGVRSSQTENRTRLFRQGRFQKRSLD